MKLWKHQKQAVEIADRRFGLFFEVGTGKTLTAIHILKKFSKAQAYPGHILIITPLITLDNWRNEILKSMDYVTPDTVKVLKGTFSKREALLQSAIARKKIVPHLNSVLILNYETLSMKELVEQFEYMDISYLIFDEAHKLKNIEAQRTKVAIKIADRVTNKLILTGTPILNSLLDVFSLFRVLDGGETFGKNIYVFRAKYFTDQNANMPRHKYFPLWSPKSNSAKRIKELISKTSMHVKKSECLDLPPMLRVKVEVELGDGQRKAYNDLKKDFITYINSSACVAELAITKALRMQQVISGYLPLEDLAGEKTIHRFNFTPREFMFRDLIEQLVNEQGHKVIVWAVFKQDFVVLGEVLDKLEIKYVEVHGGITSDKKFKNVEAFNTNDKVKVFLGHPGSGGIGINLVQASCSIFYSRTFSLEHDLQAEARNYRGGSEIHDKITRYDIIAKDTIDELIAERLAKKLALGESVLSDVISDLRKAMT